MRSVIGAAVLLLLILLNACASLGGGSAIAAPASPMSECKVLCQGGRVESFSDDNVKCKCNLPRER